MLGACGPVVMRTISEDGDVRVFSGNAGCDWKLGLEIPLPLIQEWRNWSRLVR
jgi:hypothetical protein